MGISRSLNGPIAGTRSAPAGTVGVRTFTELDAWKLSNAVKLGVYDLIREGKAARDLEFRDQIRNAAASAPRNIAEGFGRFRPREFAQYLRIANGSLMETSNHLRDGVDRCNCEHGVSPFRMPSRDCPVASE